jgi:hypothetical protein
VPENFHQVHRAWREKKLTLKQAAQATGLKVGTFYGKARQYEAGAESLETYTFQN